MLTTVYDDTAFVICSCCVIGDVFTEFKHEKCIPTVMDLFSLIFFLHLTFVCRELILYNVEERKWMYDMKEIALPAGGKSC